MSRTPREDQLVQACLLDRIGTGERADGAQSPGQTVRSIKKAIQRDLERLLNTRWCCRALPEPLDELPHSLVNYGIPDFTGTNIGTKRQQQELGRIITRVIERNEPRLRGVRVELLEDQARDRTVRFRIRATLTVTPAGEGVEYTSSFEPVTTSIRIRGAGG